MKQVLRVEVVAIPSADAERNWKSILDILADAFAQQILAEARAAAAAELGISPSELEPDGDDVADLARSHGLSLVGGDR